MELELQDNFSGVNDAFHKTLSQLSGTSATNEIQRKGEWINNSPAAPMNNNKPEAVASTAIAMSIATTTAVTSSLHPLGYTDPVTMETDGTNQAITEIGAPTTVVLLTTAGPTAVAQALISPTPPEITLPVPGLSTSSIS